jgi:cyclopropane fatty-acyl-phospholipid synthase-like methyltransferase
MYLTTAFSTVRPTDSSCICQAASSFGCEVDTLTLSKEQKSLAEERIKEAGLEGRV